MWLRYAVLTFAWAIFKLGTCQQLTDANNTQLGTFLAPLSIPGLVLRSGERVTFTWRTSLTTISLLAEADQEIYSNSGTRTWISSMYRTRLTSLIDTMLIIKS